MKIEEILSVVPQPTPTATPTIKIPGSKPVTNGGGWLPPMTKKDKEKAEKEQKTAENMEKNKPFP